jgi:SEC-C motif-containing protein
MRQSSIQTQPCPCGRTDARGRPAALADCCGRWSEAQPAPDAEALMRSRYTAFVLGDEAYLLATWDPGTRPASIAPDQGTKWLGLQVLDHRVIDAAHAEVEFVARYRVAGRGARLHERSRFVRTGDGRWLYVDGDLR